MDQLRRGNYDSGQDYVLEYGELRFTFNERDFAERVEQAALKLAFVKGRLHEAELEDLVNLTVNGEPASGTWTLRVADYEAADTGTLNSWGTSRRVITCS